MNQQERGLREFRNPSVILEPATGVAAEILTPLNFRAGRLGKSGLEARHGHGFRFLLPLFLHDFGPFLAVLIVGYQPIVLKGFKVTQSGCKAAFRLTV